MKRTASDTTKYRDNAAGYVLLETAIALPLIVFLLTVLGYVTLWSFRTYQRETADINAQEELQLAMERIVEDVQNAAVIEITPNDQHLYQIHIIMHEEKEQKVNNIKVRTSAVYRVGRLTYGQTGSMYRRLLGDAGQPMTGDSFVAGETDVTEFFWEQKGSGIIRITLGLRSVVTDHEYRLATEIFLPHANVNWLY